jgi:predicted MFS family arabinose efflux permease
MAADAISYVVSAVSLLLIKTKETPPLPRAADPKARSMRADIAEGLRYVFSHPLIRAVTACTAVINLFGMIGQAVLLIFAVRALGMSAGLIGVVFALANVGVFVGAVLSARFGRRFGMGPTIITASVLIGVGFALVPLATRPSAVPVLIAAELIGGFGGVVFNVNVVSLRQAIAPHDIQGRMNATVKFVVYGTIPLGSLFGGILGNAIGPRSTLWVAALGAFGAATLVLFSPVRRLHTPPGHRDLRPPDLGGVLPEPGFGVGPPE